MKDHNYTAILVTALKLEAKAVREHLGALSEVIHPEQTIYKRGLFQGKHGIWDVILVQPSDMGNVDTAVELERAANFFRPDVVMFVGVAGGLKDVALGDVVFAQRVYAYESGKILDDEYQSRPRVETSGYGLLQRALAESQDEDWHNRIKGNLLGIVPQAMAGSIASGEKVLASLKAEETRRIQRHLGDTLAVEMEGYGTMRAMYAHPEVQTLVIRGISDQLANKAKSDTEGWQQIAARHASAFAFELLAKYQPKGRTREKPTPPTSPTPPTRPRTVIKAETVYHNEFSGPIQHVEFHHNGSSRIKDKDAQ